MSQLHHGAPQHARSSGTTDHLPTRHQCPRVEALAGIPAYTRDPDPSAIVVYGTPGTTGPEVQVNPGE